MLHEAPSQTVQLVEIVEPHGASWSFMEFHGVSSGRFVMEFHGSSWDFMEFHGVSWSFMEFHGFSWGPFVLHILSSMEFHWL